MPDAIQFVEAAFAGKTDRGCPEKSEFDNKLNPLALGVELEPILVKLIDVLAKAGDKDQNIKNNIKVLEQTV